MPASVENGSVSSGRRVRRLVLPPLSIVCGLALWQAAISVLHPNKLAVVGPVEIARDGRELFRAGTLGPDIGTSLEQLFAGLAIAVVAGVLVGLLLGTSKWVAGAIGPWVTVLYTIPVIAVAPLVIVGLGLGDTAKITIVVASAFFPIVISTQAGAAAVIDGGLRDVTRAFHANSLETLRYLTLPGTVPHILTGIRLAIGRSLIALVAADLFGSTQGLGYLIISGQQNLKTDDVYVGVVTLSLIGLLLTAVVGYAERRVHGARTARGEAR
ncbi:NitT/TauT family transport system permease protein/sulfonate transport system permease protein [Actinacidiphila yanglinensis]|uniref:NitT/TauT family transport system permease protein/sulfonate transport system permease protein n=1 Tax=Actinacidiphila yanglinensis TaxID=310779 RepID=A0A1H6B9L1_9ACTN|nr:ABC transporter permease [Actinacidiphila yanglinensis]SEG57551.1 NitT/TauT family transport system permease protein/sulfonate transport system permease protein [Actinacidiphila yanglinensis]